MLKKTISCNDFNGVERTEDFYFNLTKSELIEMDVTAEGGLQERIDRIVKSQNGGEIMKLFKGIILKAYGEKSADGRRFMKSEEISKAFEETMFYDVLFYELVTDADAAADFVNSIIPQGGN